MLDAGKLRLTTLSENTVKWLWLLGEWGWSNLIEADGFRLLFDTGLGSSTVHNADCMGIDLTTVDKIALSHGHVDHTGGLREVLERMRLTVGHSNFLQKRPGRIDIIAHPEVWGPKFINHPGDPEYDFRGIPFQKIELEERQGARFVESREPVWITDDIVWSGEVPMLNDYEKIVDICYLKVGEGKYVDGNAEYIPDPLNDDAAIYIKTGLGLVIVLGCAHHGMINTIHHAQKITGMDKVHMVVGGTHLVKASDYQMDSTIRELKRLGVQRVGVSHCTGLASSVKLAAGLGMDVFFFNNAGNIITFS
ncbi:MAG: MBL fold metallo-hydrolase [Dehalococcoidia bacterium]|nr:MBL fold metallo-hydrolase [Dehalococcoidia bacterium]